MAEVTLYLDLLSQPCRSVYIFAKANKLPVQYSTVQLFKGEHLSEEFIKVNPLRKVPALKDGDFTLAESIAILLYLFRKFNLPDHWYPSDLQKRARVDEYLSWQHTNTRPHGSKVFWIKRMTPLLLGHEADTEKMNPVLAEFNTTMTSLEENFLQSKPFIAGDEISVADLVALVEIMQAVASGLDVFEERPKLGAWKKRVLDVIGAELFQEAHETLLSKERSREPLPAELKERLLARLNILSLHAVASKLIPHSIFTFARCWLSAEIIQQLYEHGQNIMQIAVLVCWTLGGSLFSGQSDDALKPSPAPPLSFLCYLSSSCPLSACNMSEVTLYLDLGSQPCRAVYLFAKVNKLPVRYHEIQLAKGEQLSEEFGKVNPLHKVPVLTDGDFKLTESIAILLYLVGKFNTAAHWYPLDLQKRARVDEYLAWQHTNTRVNGIRVFWVKYMTPVLLGHEYDPEKLKPLLAEYNNTLTQLEEIFLKNKPFIVGDEISIADVVAIVEIMQVVAAEVNVFQERPKLGAWKQRVEEALGTELFRAAHDVNLHLKDKTRKPLAPEVKERFLLEWSLFN
ncbi:uncharacterized protein O3C94_003418 [Discoglossus pictus]